MLVYIIEYLPSHASLFRGAEKAHQTRISVQWGHSQLKRCCEQGNLCTMATLHAARHGTEQDLQRWRFGQQPRFNRWLWEDLNRSWDAFLVWDLGRNSPSQRWLFKISTDAIDLKQTSNLNGTLVVWIGALGRGSPMFNDPFHKIYPKNPKDPGPKPWCLTI